MNKTRRRLQKQRRRDVFKRFGVSMIQMFAKTYVLHAWAYFKMPPYRSVDVVGGP